jgi:hypothetical protein
MEWCGQSFGIGRIGAERERTRARVHRLGFIRLGRVPRHASGRGEAATDEEKGSTALRWPACAEEDEDDAPRIFFNEQVSWASWAAGWAGSWAAWWAVLLDSCWAR